MSVPSLFDGEGSVILVTGASGGIGRATVALFQAAGAKVAGFDQVAAPSDLALTGDASDEQSVDAACRGVLERFGRFDCLVHTVGIVGGGRLNEQGYASWRCLMEVNLDSAFLFARATFPLLTRPGASVMLISSTNALNGGSQVSGPAYAVAKAGISNLARYLAKEWAPDGLRVNCVTPGPVDTPMLDRLDASEHAVLRRSIPLGSYVSADEVAAAIAYLCSDHARSITGTSLNISGGLSLN